LAPTAPASARLVRALLLQRAGQRLSAGVRLAGLRGEELLPEERTRLEAALAK
jgi:hypothetical protein